MLKWRLALFSTLVTGGALAACSSSPSDAPPSGTGGAGGMLVEELACEVRAAVAPTTGFFVDISDQSGIRIDNFDPDPPMGTVINDHSRLAFADLNGDGFDDIVMHSLFPNADSGVPFEHLVFLNNGDGTFADHSDASGLRDVQAGYFAFGDVDDDGDQDVFAGLDLDDYDGHTSAILLNDGTGRFTRVEGSGVEDAPYFITANALFADFDRDGHLDLFVGNGSTFAAAADFFYLGNGDGTFSAAFDRLPGSPNQPSNGSTACDYDDDGDLDIFVSTYGVSVLQGHNHLWENDGTGHFTEVAQARGFAALATGNYFLPGTGYGVDAQTESAVVGSNGFGIDCADVNGDGYLDIFLTTISHPVESDFSRKWSDPSQLLLNQGPAAGFGFVNAYLERGLPFNEGDVDGGTTDIDNDGRLDLSVSRDRKYESGYLEDDQKAWFGLFHQRPDGTFASLGTASGINDVDGASLLRMKNAQNHAWSDIDNDGDLDLLVGGRDTGGGRPNFLFRNDLGQQNRWLKIRVAGDGEIVTRDAFGTRVTLRASDRVIVREKKSSRGQYNSEDTRTLHFGLGDVPCDYVMEIRWPDGTVMQLDRTQVGDDLDLTVRYPDLVEPSF
jgi:enediyne biosynthesis protein E4